MNTKRSPASNAVRALRQHLEMTQTEFAVHALKMAISTVGRWETQQTPARDALLLLADLAEKKKRPDLADVFVKTFMQEVRQEVPGALNRWVTANG